MLKHRLSIETYAMRHPEFLTAIDPIPAHDDAPRIVLDMSAAAQATSIGPMASVAGAIAEAVGRDLTEFSPEVIVENGGDIFMRTTKIRLVGVYAGESPLTGRIAIEITPGQTPIGICTSSGTVGHSLSFGTADAVIILSPSAALADAAATATGNLIKSAADIERGTDFARAIPGIKGIVIIKDDKMGVWGEVTIIPID